MLLFYIPVNSFLCNNHISNKTVHSWISHGLILKQIYLLTYWNIFFQTYYFIAVPLSIFNKSNMTLEWVPFDNLFCDHCRVTMFGWRFLLKFFFSANRCIFDIPLCVYCHSENSVLVYYVSACLMPSSIWRRHNARLV